MIDQKTGWPGPTEQELLDAVDDTCRRVGRWLASHGLADVWPALYEHLASEEGVSVGPWDPRTGPLPPGAAWRFLLEEDAGA